MASRSLSLIALDGLPDFRPGDDLAQAILAAANAAGGLRGGDIVVVAHKAISKCEGALVDLRGVEPSAEAYAVAGQRDPRRVEVVLRQARSVVRRRGSFLVTETHHGFVCAGSGVDASNAPDDDTVVLLPVDPDGSAELLRQALMAATGFELGVIVSDSFGRAWRRGSVDVAIGVAGVRPIDDLRGGVDARGRALKSTLLAVADEIAGAAELLMGKANRAPVVVVRGLEHLLGAGSGADLLRQPKNDLFR